jgi:hypothetical protein
VNIPLQATKTAKEAEEKLNVLETQYLESQQRLAMAQNELETVKTEYEHSHTEMQQGYAAHTQLQSQYETTKAELLESNENFGKLGELLQEQSESNQHLTQQLESIRSGNNDLSSHAEELIAQVEVRCWHWCWCWAAGVNTVVIVWWWWWVLFGGGGYWWCLLFVVGGDNCCWCWWWWW